MRAYVIRRVLLLIPTFFLLTILVFLSVRFIPGDIIDILVWRMEETIGGAIDIDRAELERRLGLDVPVPVQYARWMGGGRVLHYSKDREEVYRTAVLRQADGTLALASAVLGLELRLTERGLRFHDPETGRDLPNLAETDEARQRETQARESESRARRAAETRLAQEAAARQQEAAARAAAEARVAELEASLRRERAGDSDQ